MELDSQLFGAGSQSDYRQILLDEFEKRHKQNRQFSKGAFAKFIGLTPARLHDVLSGRNGLSAASAGKIADRLQWNERDKEFFCDLVESEHGRSALNRKLAQLRLKEFHFRTQLQTVSLDVFKALSDWYHFALLELTYLEGFQSQAEWISQQLNCPQEVIQESIERLLRLDLLEWKHDQLQATNDYSAVGEDLPSSAIKKYQSQLIEKAQRSLIEQPIEQREVSSLTVAINKSQIPVAKKLMQQFLRDFCKTVEKQEPKEAVYCLSQQFFQLNQEEEKSDESSLSDH